MENTPLTPITADPQPAGPQPTGIVTVRRSRTDRMVAGVCGGVATRLGVDANLLRLGLVLLTIFGVGLGAVAYIAAWILLPEE